MPPSALFGIVGALLAIPFAATIQITARELLGYRRDVASGVAAKVGAAQSDAPSSAR